jgi:AcrR family transcriptional regulator
MSKGEDTRAAILERALATTSRLGLEGLSIGSLAQDLGMSKSGLFAHFGSKEDLQLRVLELAVERFVESVVRPALARPRGEPRVRALFENWLAWAEASYLPGGCVFIATANELDDRPGPLRDRLVDYQRQWLAVLARAARIAQEEGHFRSDLDTEQFAYESYAVLLAYHHFRRLLRDPGARDRARRAFDDLLGAARAASAA